MACQKRSQLHNGSVFRFFCQEEISRKSRGLCPGSDWSLQFDSMKSESLVIAGQNTAVNVFLSLVHTARQATKVGGIRSRRGNH